MNKTVSTLKESQIPRAAQGVHRSVMKGEKGTVLNESDVVRTSDRKGRSFLPQGVGEGFLEDMPVKLSFGRCRSQVSGSGEACRDGPGRKWVVSDCGKWWGSRW